jgi:Mn-containing catalase
VRIHKLRVYETVNAPVSREVCGYLLVLGAVHAHAYALALKHLTGVDMTKMLPVPNRALPNDPDGELVVVDGRPDGGKIPDLAGLRRLHP